MTSITFTRTNASGARRVVNRTQAPMRCVLKQAVSESLDAGSAAISIEFPYGPTDVKYQKLAPNYAQIKRPGAKDIMVRSGDPLRTVSFSATIADKQSGGLVEIERVLEQIQELAAADVDCQFIYGLSALPYPVRVTQLDVNSSRRNLEGLMTRATINVQLMEIPAFNPFLGELTAVTPVGTRGSTPSGSRAVLPDEEEAESTDVPIVYGEGLDTKEGEVVYAEVGTSLEPHDDADIKFVDGKDR
jgi:hypothetical protein